MISSNLGFRLGLHFFAIILTIQLLNSTPANAFEKSLYFETFSYEEYVYSKSKKTELGDQVEMNIGLRYDFTEDAFVSLGWTTKPEENRRDNETSYFEVLGGYRFQPFYFQIDTEIVTDDPETSGTNFGFDIDSKKTYLAYELSSTLSLEFYPFNFDGAVGHEFNTDDVTTIYMVDGAPATVSATPIGDEKIVEKTIPGLVLRFANITDDTSEQKLGFEAYAGIGSATYLYPSNDDFDIEDNPTSDPWARKEDLAYKAGANYYFADGHLNLSHVAHTEADETGSLLESATSLYTIAQVGTWITDFEITHATSGKNPYRLQRDGEWFEVQTVPFRPVYDDLAGDRHDWIGEGDFAASVRIGLAKTDFTPYLSLQYQGEHFIYKERESAHILRTADESKSHGGLQRYGVGVFIYKNKFTINPEFEYQVAENDVFTNSADVRADRGLSSFKNQDYLFYITLKYDHTGARPFKP